MSETRLKHLLARFETPERIFAAGPGELSEVKGVDAELALGVASYKRGPETEERLKHARDLGVKTLCFTSDDFPQNLKNLAHMPPVLFAIGELTGADATAIAVVGTRQPSHYGRQVAEKLGRELAQNGVTVASGLARGVDTFAHKGALDAGGRTIAVLGCGLDVFYPPENRKLYSAIAAQGAVISEYSLGVEPLAMNFPKRNRVVSGLSRGVVAVEAAEKSGVLNTVQWAVDQGRTVFAVPGNITSQQSIGINRLLKQGALPLLTVEDVLAELGIAARREERARVEVAVDEKPVLDFITAEPQHVDDICEGVGIPMQALLSVLLQLEMKGLVRQLPGKLFVREI